MNGLSFSIDHYIVAPVKHIVCGTCSRIKKGTMYVGEGLSNMAYDVYDLKNEGFEKWVKAAIASLRAYAIFNGMTDRFNIAINTFESQKDLYYATKIVGSVTHFIRKKPVDGESYFKCPNLTEGLYAVANFLDTAKFLKKNEVFEMKWASDLASKFGSFPLSSLGINMDKIPVVGKRLGWKTLAEVPVVGSFTRTPKDLFTFASSFIDAGFMICKAVKFRDSIYQMAKWDFVFDDLLKFVSSVGKMVLIVGGRSYGCSNWFAYADFYTQWASLGRYWWKRSSERHNRFENPPAAARA